MSKLSEQEFHVQHVDRDLATGDKVEPEQQPVDKIAPLPVSVDWARPNFENPGPPIKLGHVTDKYNATIAVEMSAGDVAKGFLTNCLNCRSFDPDGFQKYLRAAEARNDREALAEIQRAKGAMINSGCSRRRIRRLPASCSPIGLRRTMGPAHLHRSMIGRCALLREGNPEWDRSPDRRCTSSSRRVAITAPPQRGSSDRSGRRGPTFCSSSWTSRSSPGRSRNTLQR